MNKFLLVVSIFLLMTSNAFAGVIQVPEPTSLLLLGLGVAGLVVLKKKI